MGKRIPGKKHRGVKDPMIQKSLREESLKNKINAPPKEIDCQEIPKSLERVMKLKQMTKEGMFNKIKKKNKVKNKLMDTSKLIDKEKLQSGMSKPDRNLPTLVQKQGESDRGFLHRVHIATTDFIKEVNFEVKHNMKMRRDEKTGQVRFDKMELDPVEKMFRDKLQAQAKGKVRSKQRKQVGELSLEGLSKTARRRLRMQAKKERLRQEEGEGSRGSDEPDWLQDKVEFNERVDRPPQLTAVPRKSDALDIGRRPASKPGLLLSGLLGGHSRDLTGRRRDLAACDRRALDSAQATAIQAYRQMKATRANINNVNK